MYSKITKKTFESIFNKKYELIKVLLIPFVLLTIIEYFNTPLLKENIGSANYYLFVALSLLITLIMSISVHRVLLLDSKLTPKWGIYKFTGREVTFALKAIGLGLLLALLGVILFFVTMLLEKVVQGVLGKEFVVYFSIAVIIGILTFLGVIFSRVSLVFPAIAIDKPMDFGDAFEISKNHKLLIFLCVLIIPVFFGLLVALVYGLAIGFLMNLISQKLSVLLSLLNIFITVFTIAFLSTTYEYIMGIQPEKIEEVEELREIEYKENENSYKVNIDDRYEISFEDIKKSLQKQYENLGFTKIKLDKEDSWLLKNPEIEKAYVLLTHSNNQYTIETFNVLEKPIININ